jgi:glucokinase
LGAVETTVAIDLGGTHLRAALVSDEGQVLIRDRQRTPVDDPQPDIIPTLIDWARRQAPEVAGGVQPPTRATIGVPGIIDHGADQPEEAGGGRLVHAPNLPERWVPSLSEAWIGQRCGLDVSLANDADLAAVGESSFGAGRRYRDVAYVTISTGVGAGIVVADRLVRGRFSGGELGHTVIDRAALAAGEPATVEDLGSGTALGRAAAAAGLSATGAELAQLVRNGDPVATEVWHETLSAVGLGIANLAWIVAPDIVVVGGGVGVNADLVVPIIEEQVHGHGPARSTKIIVATAELGDDAGLAGAATWWKAIGRA